MFLSDLGFSNNLQVQAGACGSLISSTHSGYYFSFYPRMRGRYVLSFTNLNNYGVVVSVYQGCQYLACGSLISSTVDFTLDAYGTPYHFFLVDYENSFNVDTTVQIAFQHNTPSPTTLTTPSLVLPPELLALVITFPLLVILIIAGTSFLYVVIVAKRSDPLNNVMLADLDDCSRNLPRIEKLKRLCVIAIALTLLLWMTSWSLFFGAAAYFLTIPTFIMTCLVLEMLIHHERHVKNNSNIYRDRDGIGIALIVFSSFLIVNLIGFMLGAILLFSELPSITLVTSSPTTYTSAILPNTSTTSSATYPSYSIDYLIVAGGGGGSGSCGAGGGAGGMIESSQVLALSGIQPSITFTVTVGNGGAGGFSSTGQASSGQNSILSGTGFVTQIAIGGGYGATSALSASAGNGGSGGGANNTPFGKGTSGQGNNGGSGISGWTSGGGGGGAGSPGENAPSNLQGGNGGNGLASNITGTSVIYAGGGAGSQVTSGKPGLGGGGTATGTGGTGGDGVNGLGGGGGGGGDCNGGGGNGGNGGSGIVIASIPSFLYRSASGAYITSIVNSNSVISFTSSGTLIVGYPNISQPSFAPTTTKPTVSPVIATISPTFSKPTTLQTTSTPTTSPSTGIWSKEYIILVSPFFPCSDNEFISCVQMQIIFASFGCIGAAISIVLAGISIYIGVSLRITKFKDQDSTSLSIAIPSTVNLRPVTAEHFALRSPKQRNQVITVEPHWEQVANHGV